MCYTFLEENKYDLEWQPGLFHVDEVVAAVRAISNYKSSTLATTLQLNSGF